MASKRTEMITTNRTVKKYLEINCDGLAGPTHHYGGLAYGNLASIQHKGQLSNPRAAALEGLAKMKWCVDQGFKQLFIPPHPRPHIEIARERGYTGKDQDILEKCAKEHPSLLSSMFSSAFMWVANAATVTSSLDNRDGKVHITPANLGSHRHRSIETEFTQKNLKKIFKNDYYFKHHAPVNSEMQDEGAANHTRLSPHYGAKGIHIMVYGKSILDKKIDTKRYPARQTKEAFDEIIKQHHINQEDVIYVRQAAKAIDAGCFHNDVIALGNESTFLVHEHAFENQEKTIRRIRNKYYISSGFYPHIIIIKENELSLEEAIKTYFFNGQLLSYANKKMVLLLPSQCQESKKVQAVIQKIVSDENPIESIHYVNLQQSMQNGGGPACLRLRVQLSTEELSVINHKYVLTNKKITAIKNWVNKYYPEELTINDLIDPVYITSNQEAFKKLDQLMEENGNESK